VIPASFQRNYLESTRQDIRSLIFSPFGIIISNLHRFKACSITGATSAGTHNDLNWQQ